MHGAMRATIWLWWSTLVVERGEACIELETPNLREAGEFALADSPQSALAMSAGLFEYSIARGYLSEMSHWLQRVLIATADTCSVDRVAALYGATVIACLRGDVSSATTHVSQAQALVAQIDDPRSYGLDAIAAGFTALVGGRWESALAHAENGLAATDDPLVQVPAMILRGRVLEHDGEIGAALIWQEKALAITEAAGELVYRSDVLWSLGIGWWVNGKPQRAQQLLRQCLDLSRQIDDPRNTAACLESLAWIAGAHGDAERAVVLMGAAQTLGNGIGVTPSVLPDLVGYHDQCRLSAQKALGSEAFEVALRYGAAMDLDQAVRYVCSDL
jgi:non-specific serine/threonine protein kinase